MVGERFSENLTLGEMKCTLGDNGWGTVYPQGDVPNIKDIDQLLKKAGGKPKTCPLDDYTMGSTSKAKPEYIITINDDSHTIIVVECKNTAKKHQSKNLDCPSGYAVDGVLYYAKFLKEKYNVIAIAISGTAKETVKADAFYWGKGLNTYDAELLKKAKDIILEPKNYIKLIRGEKLQKGYSIDEIRETAIEMHDCLREIGVREEHKPIFIAGILIALSDDDFCKMYSNLPSFKAVMASVQTAIENVLNGSDIKSDRAVYIKSVFKTLQDNTKFAGIPLIQKKSINRYIERLELKIKPMMDYADSAVDALGVFYHEFIRYSGGDGSGLGIVLTPQHLTEFMCELAGVNKNSVVVDICCGSGSFLVTAMSKMFRGANPRETEAIRKERLYGVEFDDGLYTLAIANMIIRQDGKSNIFKGDCFNADIVGELKAKNINVGLINPPYSQTDKCELEFVEQLLEVLSVGGVGVVVVPMSCAIGTKFKEARERLFKKHTLMAVFSMPDDLFAPFTPNAVVMAWQAHTPHDCRQDTFFGYYKNDGFIKRKKLGRIDYYGKWPNLLSEWLKLYRNRVVQDGLSAMRCVSHKDEWLCEAYMKTDYTVLSKKSFQTTVNEYLAYLVKFFGLSRALEFAGTEHQKTVAMSDVRTWKEFQLKDLFKFEHCKCGTARELSDGDDCFYIGAKKTDNGVMKTVAFDGEYVSKGNGLVFICNGQGSVGYALYADRDFIGTTSNMVGYCERLNTYIGLFLVTVLDLERPRYSFGRKWYKTLPETIIKLPSISNEPDWDYMERFVKSLP